jgi:cephalosporin hydroxylase
VKKVITIDIVEKENRPQHKRLKCLRGSSKSEEIVTLVKGLIDEKDRVMVILDSDHHKGMSLKN